MTTRNAALELLRTLREWRALKEGDAQLGNCLADQAEALVAQLAESDEVVATSLNRYRKSVACYETITLDGADLFTVLEIAHAVLNDSGCFDWVSRRLDLGVEHLGRLEAELTRYLEMD